LDISRVVADADTGFAAYQLTDPDIIADLLGDGAVDGPDGAALGRYINGATVPQVPVFPGNPVNMLPGADPTVSIPSALALVADGTVTVPVNIDDAAPAGSLGMTQATLAVSYDPAVFSVSAGDIRLGSVPASGRGWTLDPTVDAATGQIGVTIWSATPITSSAPGSLVTIVFHRTAAAAAATTTIDLASAVNPNGGRVMETQVDDSQGPYTLTPAPSDAFDPRIDGVVNLGGVSAAVPTALAKLVTSVIAGPAAASSAGAVASQQAGAARVSQHAADGLFAALGSGVVNAAELALGGASQGLAAELGASGSAQAKLDSLIWESEESVWQDGKRDWLP